MHLLGQYRLRKQPSWPSWEEMHHVVDRSEVPFRLDTENCNTL